MVKLLVPTRNRPEGVASLLRYIAMFHPENPVLIADGSDPEMQRKVAAICQDFAGRLQLDFRPYPSGMPLFERLGDVLGKLSDNTLAMGADDDFPLLDVYAQADAHLRNNPEINSIVPADITIRRVEGGMMASRLSFSRSILNDLPVDRARKFAARSFATSYGVTRRHILLERYASLAKYYCAGFIDFQIGLLDAVQGRVLAWEHIGCIRTNVEGDGHLRPVEPLIFVRRSGQILKFSEDIARRLAATMDEKSAKMTASELVECRILELIGPKNRWQSQKHKSILSDDPAIQGQVAALDELFSANSRVRGKLLARLRYVVDQFPPASIDSSEKPSLNYETL
jgi:glycosyltransferase domain-containing protein